MKDAVRNLLICSMFTLAGGKHEKQENKKVVDNTMMATRRSKAGVMNRLPPLELRIFGEAKVRCCLPP